MGNDAEHRWARLEVPKWLYGGHPEDFLRRAALISRVDKSAGSTARRVTTNEAYNRRAPSLIEVRRIEFRNGAVAPTSNGSIASLIRDDLERPVLELARDRTEHELSRLTGSPLVVACYSARLKISTAIGSGELAREVAHWVGALGSISLEGTREPALGQVDAWAVHRDDSLVVRLKFMALLLRLRVDSRLAAGDTKSLEAELEEAGGVFKSSERLVDGVTMLDPYLGPLVSSLTPSVWGILCPRLSGTVLLSFGTSVAGSSAVPHSMLETVGTRGPESGFRAASFSLTNSPRGAIEWWVTALNGLFGWLTDPAVFVDADGTYDPLAQLETVASVEQVFRRMLSIQTLHRDATARMTLMFSVLDTLETLTGLGQSTLYSVAGAEKTLMRLKEELGASDEVLLPAASRAVNALREVAEGFFLRDGDGRVPVRASQKAETAENAVVYYLQMLRNAGHGFGSKVAKQWEVDANLMVRHTGETPHDLALLPWLYLLDMLANPQRNRDIMAKRKEKRARA